MENRRLFFLLASIVLATISIVSCDKDSMIEPNESFYADPNAVSSKEAVNVAEAYILSDKKITTRADGLKVKSYSSIKDEVGSDIIHVFNYEGGGFALISGDNRLEPVLAYSESASFGNDVNAFPVGLRIWVEGIKSKLDKIKSDDLPQEASIKCLWDKYNGVVMTRSLDPWSGIDPECDTIVGPLLTNTWHQYASFNDYLIDAYHFNTFTNMYDTLHKPVVGCFPLSIARVLHFWGYPTSFPWSSMSSTSANHYTKTFLSDVHYDVKNYAESHSYYFGYCYYPSVSAPRNYATSVSTTFPIGTFICYITNRSYRKPNNVWQQPYVRRSRPTRTSAWPTSA